MNTPSSKSPNGSRLKLSKKQIFALFFLAFLAVFPLFSSRGWQAELKHKIKKHNAPSWMAEQIQEDLLPYAKTPITQELLNRTMSMDHGDLLLARFTIKNGEISFTCFDQNKPHGNILSVQESLQKLANLISLPDVDFILCAGDGCPYVDFPVPIFTFAKDGKKPQKAVLFPDYEALNGHFGALKQIEEGKKKYPWEKKENTAFWRGATSGRMFSSKDFLEMPRTKIVQFSLNKPHLVDARFTFFAQCTDPEVVQSMYAAYFDKMSSIKKHLKSKYQLLIDGNSCAYGRAYWQLFSECPIFKQKSPHIQWYYRNLIPYQHYIPLKEDCSDLIEKIQWAQAHDKEVKQIAENAYKFAQKNLKYSDILYYVYLVLTEYKKLQGF
jgi:hypothetical protein